jgi:predicted RNase H-like nuclease (RuvC/YqgF family)
VTLANEIWAVHKGVAMGFSTDDVLGWNAINGNEDLKQLVEWAELEDKIDAHVSYERDLGASIGEMQSEINALEAKIQEAQAKQEELRTHRRSPERDPNRNFFA